MTFRNATEEDIPALLAMQERFFADMGDPLDLDASGRAMRELVSDPRLGRLLVTDGGYMVLGFGFSLEFGGRDAFVDELYLVPEARGRGLGSVALRVAEEVCRETGIQALHLEVAHDNPRARELYARSGYYAHERHLMTKRLT
jgi:GNAT superfamily N-acetyltransferase